MKSELNVKLSDIGGYEAEKREAQKLADILAHFELYKSKGASIPKGLLISGDPGVGKTMLAKAIATEAGIPFFELEVCGSGQEDVCEIIERTFAEAKASGPSILFIDEIDELIPTESYFSPFRSDGSRGVLKTLLTELDGGSSSDGVLVVVTTNRKSYISPALLRSGRLERQIELNNPDCDDRKAIFEIYLKQKGVGGVDCNALAKKTNGFTGADIKTIVNEVLLNSIRENREPCLSDFDDLIPVIRFGNIKSNVLPSRKPHVAWHEIGHLLCQYSLTGKLSTISIQSYGTIAGFNVAEDELESENKETEDLDADRMLDKVTISLGGMAAEEVFLGKRYCGSFDDIVKAVTAIKEVLSNGVMGFHYIPSLLDLDSSFMGRSGTFDHALPGIVSQKIIDILEERFELAVSLIKEKKELGESIYPRLINKGTLSKDEIEAIIGDHP